MAKIDVQIRDLTTTIYRTTNTGTGDVVDNAGNIITSLIATFGSQPSGIYLLTCHQDAQGNNNTDTLLHLYYSNTNSQANRIDSSGLEIGDISLNGSIIVNHPGGSFDIYVDVRGGTAFNASPSRGRYEAIYFGPKTINDV